MTKDVYTATINGASLKDREAYGCGSFCVTGPGQGLGYYSWAEYPNRNFHTLEQAESVAKMMNVAYQAGMKEKEREIKEVLGFIK